MFLVNIILYLARICKSFFVYFAGKFTILCFVHIFRKNFFHEHAPYTIRLFEKGIHVYSETLPAVTLAAMNPGPPKYYHTRDDNVSVLEMKTLEDALKVVLETVFLFDEQGLKDSY